MLCERGLGGLQVEAQPRARTAADAKRAKLVRVLVDPCATEPEAPCELACVHQSGCRVWTATVSQGFAA
jgi:hypothetical protein